MDQKLFWDNTPFCTLLFIDEKYRGQGLGRLLMDRWESDMKSQDYGMLMTSTQVDEDAQHFYRKLEKPANPFLPNGLDGEVLSVYTESEYRGKGICTQLMKNMIEFAKEAVYIRI